MLLEEISRSTMMSTPFEGFSDTNSESSSDCCVVTGGRGFAARNLVQKLLKSRRWKIVRIADLPHTLNLDDHDRGSILQDALEVGRAVFESADVTRKQDLIKVFHGASVVFHMAAPNPSINDFKLHYRVTVQGTQSVISACLECKVKRLIYTSSASVVFDGLHDIINGDESMTYPDKHNDIYSEMKAQAEAMVLESNGRQGLSTCALRPSSIFGAGDDCFVPLIVTQARAGKMKFVIGHGKNMYDFTYVDNVSHAHICAEQAMNTAAHDVGGKAFFITNMEPIRFWDFVSSILEGLGYHRPYIKIPEQLAMVVAKVLEYSSSIMASDNMSHLTCSRLRLISRTRTFNCARAQNYIGYSPTVSLEEGIKRTLESFVHLRSEMTMVSKRQMDKSSKVYRLLGGGRVADILLWRDDRKTFAIAMVVAFIIYYFYLSGYRFFYAAARLLLMVISALLIYGCLPSPILGLKIKSVPPSYFEISEESLQIPLQCLRLAWNSGVTVLRSLARGNDWELFLKAVLLLYVLKCIGSISFPTLVVTGYIFFFTFFCIYEQKEEEIDFLGKAAIGMLSCIKKLLIGKLPHEAKKYFKNA
eukprot:TRINITY_DN6041_c0_g1_i1.p1 TRINITY_DN6041_c0_g1~~TRINITY_DN6041_c0_g1_i1.p1  ORF type:complete len:588 (+),score=48.61 TRINITY_DN6041_c0_g1_i1:84-1847(+)